MKIVSSRRNDAWGDRGVENDDSRATNGWCTSEPASSSMLKEESLQGIMLSPETEEEAAFDDTESLQSVQMPLQHSTVEGSQEQPVSLPVILGGLRSDFSLQQPKKTLPVVLGGLRPDFSFEATSRRPSPERSRDASHPRGTRRQSRTWSRWRGSVVAPESPPRDRSESPEPPPRRDRNEFCVPASPASTHCTEFDDLHISTTPNFEHSRELAHLRSSHPAAVVHHTDDDRTLFWSPTPSSPQSSTEVVSMRREEEIAAGTSFVTEEGQRRKMSTKDKKKATSRTVAELCSVNRHELDPQEESTTGPDSSGSEEMEGFGNARSQPKNSRPKQVKTENGYSRSTLDDAIHVPRLQSPNTCSRPQSATHRNSSPAVHVTTIGTKEGWERAPSASLSPTRSSRMASPSRFAYRPSPHQMKVQSSRSRSNYPPLPARCSDTLAHPVMDHNSYGSSIRRRQPDDSDFGPDCSYSRHDLRMRSPQNNQDPRRFNARMYSQPNIRDHMRLPPQGYF